MTKLTLAAFALALCSTASTAYADWQSTVGWGCHTCEFKNGTQLTGIAMESTGDRAVQAVRLPTGKVVALR